MLRLKASPEMKPWPDGWADLPPHRTPRPGIQPKSDPEVASSGCQVVGVRAFSLFSPGHRPRRPLMPCWKASMCYGRSARFRAGSLRSRPKFSCSCGVQRKIRAGHRAAERCPEARSVASPDYGTIQYDQDPAGQADLSPGGTTSSPNCVPHDAVAAEIQPVSRMTHEDKSAIVCGSVAAR